MTGRPDDTRKGISEKRVQDPGHRAGVNVGKGGKATSPMVTGFKAECVTLDVRRLKHWCREDKVALP